MQYPKLPTYFIPFKTNYFLEYLVFKHFYFMFHSQSKRQYFTTTQNKW